MLSITSSSRAPCCVPVPAALIAGDGSGAAVEESDGWMWRRLGRADVEQGGGFGWSSEACDTVLHHMIPSTSLEAMQWVSDRGSSNGARVLGGRGARGAGRQRWLRIIFGGHDIVLSAC